MKPKLILEIVVTGGSADRVRWGDWGEAVMLAFRYGHPRTSVDVEIRQAVRVPRDLPFDLMIGERHELVCWGVMPSGMLRHPVLAVHPPAIGSASPRASRADVGSPATARLLRAQRRARH